MKQLYFMLCMALMLLYGMPASAQTSHGISGKVTDQTGNGIAGASVIVKGTTTGTSTGSDGSYSLNVKDGNATLVCSFIGMKSAEAAVNGRTEVNFALEADAIGLEEVIAIGYGTIRKEEITSSITRVSSDEFLQGSVSNPLQLLQGKVAGLGISKTSGNPSGELSIMLRGISTLAASSAPLIVIDGVAGGSLNAISPEDIESIDVLKDGSAAAIYGTRGTNGVIIINTKRPQSGRVALEYKGYVTIDQMLDETSDYPDATELRSLKSRLAKEDSRFDLINDFKGDTDWVREITRTPVSQTHYVSLQGGNARTNYLASVTYNDKQGIYKGSFDESLTAKLSINHAMFDDRFKIALNVSNKIVTQGIVPDDLYMQALSRNPTIPVYNADGSYSDASGCGNETASERAMVRHYIVESVKFWAKEYHIDGFRFDLMGIHDIETMNRIREELSKIDPTIFIYGEGWLAADSPLPPEKRAVRDHVGQMEGIAVFCDDFRDAVRGSTFDEHACGYASGNIGGHYEPVKFGIVGATQHPQVDYNGLLYSSVPYAAAPSQAVNFVASHDGYTVIDKLRLSVTGNRAEEELLPIDKLIHTILLTAQGVPFIRAGEEMMQDKQGEPNSFRSPDAVNQIDWALKAEHRGLFDYIRQLIALRKAHPAFRIPTAEGLRQWLRFLDTGDSGVIAYTLGEHANGDAWKEILVAYNGNRHPAEFRIPEAERIVVCRDGRIDPDSRERLSGEVVRMAPSSALIAYCE